MNITMWEHFSVDSYDLQCCELHYSSTVSCRLPYLDVGLHMCPVRTFTWNSLSRIVMWHRQQQWDTIGHHFHFSCGTHFKNNNITSMTS